MYYSRVLAVCRIDNTCAKCEKTFAKWSDYHAHAVEAQCVAPKQMGPVSDKRNLIGVKAPLSDEQKAIVVLTWETRQKQGAIIQ